MPRPKRTKGAGSGRQPKVKQEWAVEKVMAKRYVSGSIEYFVKWMGYSSTQNTWEPPENLQKCQNVIDEYEEALQRRQNSENGTVESMQVSPSLPLLDHYGASSVTLDEEALEETLEVEEPPVEYRKKIVNNRRPARAFHNYRYDAKAEDFYYIIEWEDKDECEDIPGSVAREKYPELLIQFLSQNYARMTNRRSFENGHGNSFHG